MNKRQVKWLIAGYFAVFFGAVFLRIDYFPLSWVPMYSAREAKTEITVVVDNLDRRELGFAATRANGERTFLSRRDLNVPPANFRRLYQQRAFGSGPPQHGRERLALSAFNEWWYETLVGPDPALSANYQRDLINSINRTFGYGSDDPRRFVRLEVNLDFATYSQDRLKRGDLDRPQLERRTAIVTPEGGATATVPTNG